MKLSTNTDFTKLPRAASTLRTPHSASAPAGSIALPHDERHLRRKVLTVSTGEKILVDLPEAVSLGHGDRLVLEDGRQVEVHAEPEAVYDIRARDSVHLAELAWHIGNRHLAASIAADRILILRDHVIKAMLEGLGATVTEIVEQFEPVRGAYAGHGAHRDHGHSQNNHDHGRHHDDHDDRDRFGRAPGDPHYGHNHG